ncbi:MAG TPA: hypothetical protein VFQ35_08490 [Polyangiaceae bacterium]|nr:hypothetical protein [Polyangiaceae bacterium]
MKRWLERAARIIGASVMVCIAPVRAYASVALCVDIKASDAERAGFEKLVRSELARHPSHRVGETACDSRLEAELFWLGKSRYLTLRIDQEVPLRYTLQSDRDLEIRLSEGISRVLNSDPAYLAEDPSRLSAGERATRAVLVHGSNSYRLAFFEGMARTDNGLAFAPGLALEVARGSGHYSVFARSAVAYNSPRVGGDERALNVLGQAEVGALYEFAPRAVNSAYVGLSAGALLLRFAGRLEPSDPKSADAFTTAGAMLSARVGVRFLRIYDFDFDAFGAVVAPLFASKNPDSVLFGTSGAYTPVAELGLGVGF